MTSAIVKKRLPFSSLKQAMTISIQPKQLTINEKVLMSYVEDLKKKIDEIKGLRRERLSSSMKLFSLKKVFPEEIIILKNNLLSLFHYFTPETRDKCLILYSFLLFDLLKKEEREIINATSVAIMVEDEIISYNETGNFNEFKLILIKLFETIIRFTECFIKNLKIKTKNTTTYLKTRQTTSKNKVQLLPDAYMKLINVYTPLFIITGKLFLMIK